MTVSSLATRRRVGWLAVAVLLALAAGAALAPWPARLDGRSSGDAKLAAEVRRLAEGTARVGLAVAVLDDGELRQAGLGGTGTGAGVRPNTPFEIGSVTKTLTASLLADLAADGVVAPDEKVRDVLPDRSWRRGGVGDATLAELASHRSGLPRLPQTPATYLASPGQRFLGLNPYGNTEPADVLDAAAESSLPNEGRHEYSNLGFAFLGQVLAERTGKPYPELLRQRVLGPVGMSATVVPTEGVAPPGTRAMGHDGTGRQVQPWTSAGDAPAGAGVWSTAAELARFGDQVSRGQAPGADAAKPRYDAGDGNRIGYAWVTSEKRRGGSIVWHNGTSGGCAAFLGFDRATGKVVAVLSNTDTPVDALGTSLLAGGSDRDEPSSSEAAVAVGLLLPPAAGLAALGAPLGGLRRRPRRTPDRAKLLGVAAETVLIFVVAFVAGAIGPWSIAGWLAGFALAGAGAFVAATRWRELPWNSAKRPRLHWASASAAVAMGIGLLTAVAATS